MTYKQFMVVALKSNGKILRENEDIVYLPFGSEYTILLKNLESSRKAKVTIEIDGEDVLDGHSLLINPKETFELEGFLHNTIAKSAFRFIKKTEEISTYRGDRIDDGLITVTFQYEKLKPIVQGYIAHTYTYPIYPYPWKYYWPWYTDNITGTNINYNTNTNSLYSCSIEQSKSVNVDSCDSGITVHGNKINQEFQYGDIGILEENKYTIVLHLKGITETDKIVEKPVFVSDKITCTTCGRSSKSNAKFCKNCGTCLE